MELLPERIKDVEIIAGAKYQPIITDDFIMVWMRDEVLPMKGNRGETVSIRGDYQKGQKFVIKFKAARVKP